MKSESENLTARESLDLITAMIRQAQGNVQKNNFYFLLWGWVVAVANLGMYTLSQMGYRHFYIVWLITIPAAIITVYRGAKRDETQTVRNHIDRITGSIWMCFGIVIFTLVAFGYKINFQLNPVILLISAIPTFTSGVILRFKPLLFGGVSFWILGIICFFVSMQIQPLIGALAIALGYLVPGYLLKNKEIRNV